MECLQEKIYQNPPAGGLQVASAEEFLSLTENIYDFDYKTQTLPIIKLSLGQIEQIIDTLQGHRLAAYLKRLKTDQFFNIKLPIDLEKLVSDFYLVEYMHNTGHILLPDKYELLLQCLSRELTENYVDVFEKYIYLACMTELRHFDEYCELNEIYSDEAKVAFETRQLLTESGIYYLMGLDKITIHKYLLINWDRDKAREHLKVAQRAFNNLRWHEDYGGEMWGQIAQFGVDWLSGRIKNKTIFLDTCFSLEHNTDSFLNKNDKIFTKHFEIERLLYFQHMGYLDELSRHASEEVRKLYYVFKKFVKDT